MNRLLSILLLYCVYSHLYAQTPYDSFSPATSRPILDVVQDMDTYKDSLQPSPMDAPLATTDDISKWISPDPLCDKYPEISPYAYCGWNPVKYIDPDGRYFDEVNEGTAQKIEAECQHKLSSQKINHNRRKELNKTLQDIADMRNDGKNEYRFELDKNKPGTTGKEEKDGHQVITMYSNLETLDETVAHEVRHGGQVARGEMSYDNMGNPQKYEVRKEVDAYRAQWGWQGSPLGIPIDDGKYPMPVPANANYLDITNKLIKSITNGWLDKNDKLYNFK